MLNLLAPLLYIQVSPERLTVRNPKTGSSWSEVPEVAISKARTLKILAIGAEARLHSATEGVQIVNPFGHPRTMVGDFTAGEALLRLAVQRVHPRHWWSSKPRVVLHLLGDPLGGFTQVELRAFREMAWGAGAVDVVMWLGAALTDVQLLKGDFPAVGKIVD
ncbi:rod shape-determining protein [uncultured Rhodoferax sp.]|uniref:rod shape-determining protein n=1 Tax=uncultured Rhodoferax sp. TaxID=223188 RepID=UPI0025EDA2C2|nr:rod shape-determining protein [uncultured Rhodoferax sp.]